MRRLLAAECCLTLALAFLLSPFQHVHPGSDHDHAATMHAHFYGIAAAHEHAAPAGPAVDADDDDDHGAVWSMDSYTLVPPAALIPFIPLRTAATLFAPPIPIAWVDVVEERGHDPPLHACSTPRAPPY
jgi:hypothetical protein